MKEDLKTTFANVNDWLKYAETKNATLTAFNGVAIFGFLQAWGVLTHELVVINVLSLTVSSLMTLISFTPRISKILNQSKIQPQNWPAAKASINLLYFGDLSRLTTSQFTELFGEQNSQSIPYQPTATELNFINQILVNAEITITKNKWFRHAIRLSILTIALDLLYVSHLVFSWLKL